MGESKPRSVKVPPYLEDRETVNLAQAVAWARFRQNPLYSHGGMTVDRLRSIIGSLLPNDLFAKRPASEDIDERLPDASLRPSRTLLEWLEDGSAEKIRRLLTPWRMPDLSDLVRDRPEFTWKLGHVWLTDMLRHQKDEDDERREAMLRDRLDPYLNPNDAVRPPKVGCVWVGEIEASADLQAHERWILMAFDPPPGSAQSWGLKFSTPASVYSEFFHRQVRHQLDFFADLYGKAIESGDDESSDINRQRRNFDQNVTCYAPLAAPADLVGEIERLGQMLDTGSNGSTREKGIKSPKIRSRSRPPIRYRLLIPRDHSAVAFKVIDGQISSRIMNCYEISTEDLLREFPPKETRGASSAYKNQLFRGWLYNRGCGNGVQKVEREYEEFLAKMIFRGDPDEAAERKSLMVSDAEIKRELANFQKS